MCNLVIKNENTKQHANRYNLTPKADFSKKYISDNINFLNELGIDRKIIKNNKQNLYISDSFSHIFDHEDDLDKKHSIDTASLTNVLFRSITKKIGKYNLGVKIPNSYLVILKKLILLQIIFYLLI